MATLATTYYAKENLGTNYPMVKFDANKELTGGIVTLYKNPTGLTDYVLAVRPVRIGEIGTSPSVFNGKEWEWCVDADLSCDDINELLNSIRDDCVRMINSTDTVERLSIDEKIRDKCHDVIPHKYMQSCPLHASEWATSEQELISAYHITPATSDSELKRIAEIMQRDAEECEYELFDTLDYLTEVRDILS